MGITMLKVRRQSFYALEVGLGLASAEAHPRDGEQPPADCFYALEVGLGLARDADFRPL